MQVAISFPSKTNKFDRTKNKTEGEEVFKMACLWEAKERE